MWLPRTCALLIVLASVRCEKVEEEEDASTVFLEAAKSFLSNKDNLNGLQGLARTFIQSDVGKQVRNFAFSNSQAAKIKK